MHIRIACCAVYLHVHVHVPMTQPHSLPWIPRAWGLQLVAAMLGIWILSSLLAVVEIFKFPVYGKGVPDHHVH